MRKLTLLFAVLLMGFAAQAQLSLSGTTYTQNFDNIGTGLPVGWEVDSIAGPSYIGVSDNFDTAKAAWAGTTYKFKNLASKTPFPIYAGTTQAIQNLSTDRALGVRQTSARDSGLAFTLQIANTTNLANFNLSFSLQSLDSTSPRVATWLLQYATGATPTNWTTVSVTGTMTTGGNTFSASTNTASFGTALNNISTPVWIRIVTLSKTTGAGNRPTTAIDNFNLTWTGSAAVNYKPVVTALNPTDNSTGIMPGTNLQVTFDRGISKGSGNIYVKNETAQSTQTIAASSSSVTVNGNVATIAGATLSYGSSYHVTFDSAAFDTAGYKSYGIYDTTDWNFSTPPAVITVTSLNENFDSCAANKFSDGWVQRSVSGSNQFWRCSGTSTAPNYYATMNGFSGTAITNEDWLISPKLNLAAMSNPQICWRTRWSFTGPALEVLVSSTYTGYGDPNAATWTSLGITYSAVDSGNWHGKCASVNAYKGTPFFLAYKYASDPTNGAARWDVDTIVTSDVAGIRTTATTNLPLTIVGTPTANEIQFIFTADAPALASIVIMDITGRKVYGGNFNAMKGANRYTVQTSTLPAGMYLLRLEHKGKVGVAKAVVQ